MSECKYGFYDLKDYSATISIPETSNWQMKFANVIYAPPKGQEPNWFNRKMQELCFGVKWEKKA